MSNVPATKPRWSITPYFIVDDVVARPNHYRDKLGFSYDRFWGEPPCFCMVHRNGVIVMLSQFRRGDVMRPNRRPGVWLPRLRRPRQQRLSALLRPEHRVMTACERPWRR